MLGIVELALIVVILLATGGIVSRVARWILFRRAPGAGKALSALLDWKENKESARADDDGPPRTVTGL